MNQGVYDQGVYELTLLAVIAWNGERELIWRGWILWDEDRDTALFRLIGSMRGLV